MRFECTRMTVFENVFLRYDGRFTPMLYTGNTELNIFFYES